MAIEDDWEQMSMSQLSFEKPSHQDMNSGAEELRHQNYWVQLSGVESLAVKRRLYMRYSALDIWSV
jgi:hypothetical protein